MLIILPYRQMDCRHLTISICSCLLMYQNHAMGFYRPHIYTFTSHVLGPAERLDLKGKVGTLEGILCSARFFTGACLVKYVTG